MSTKSTTKCPICGCKFWDTWRLRGIKECSNCGYQRFYSVPVKDYSKPSKAQLAALEKIKAYFRDRTKDEIESCEIKPLGSDYRKLWFDVKTKGSVFTRDGGYGTIGRRGKIEFAGCANIYSTDEQVKHFNRILG